MSLRERQRLQVRADIQRAAFDLFARDGFEDVTTEQIAAAAGVSAIRTFGTFVTRRICCWIRSGRAVPES